MEIIEAGSISTGARFKLKDFEGPLDLLLFLIKKNEINIYDIPVAQITEQYLGFLKSAIELNLDELTDFHAMAATLLYVKSRMLLPTEFALEDDADDPRQELVIRLIEYQRFKKLSELMEEKEREAEWFIERKKMQRLLPFTEEDNLEQPDVRDLLKTFSSLMSNLTEERIIDLYEEVSVNEKITLIAEYLEIRGECRFSDLLIRKGSLAEIVCAFLAVLEAVKIRMISVTQARLFGDIAIYPKLPVEDGSEADSGIPAEGVSGAGL
jgi:segregation and condensation protein A